MEPRIPIERYPEVKRLLPYGKVPFGYRASEDPYTLVPDEEQIIILEQAFDYIDAGSSLREVQEWISQKLLRSLVHQTVANLYKKHRKPYQFARTNRKVFRKDTPKRSKESIEKGIAKAKITRAKKNYNALEAKYAEKALKPEDFPEGPPVRKERVGGFIDPLKREVTPPVLTEDIKIIFKPHPGPQTVFLSASEEEVLYGGAAGGGKSYAMIADPMRYFENPNFVGLLLRRTNDELRELKWETQKLYKAIWPDAQWKQQESMWVLPSGAKLWMTYLERDDDVMRYVGQSFSWIGVDELTQYASPFAWQFLKSRLRSTDPQLQKHLCMRATTNPGGPGHNWVKKMFIDPAPYGEAFWATDIETGETMTYPKDFHDETKAGKPLFKRRFIPALLKDNPSLYASGEYERSLLGLPEAQRRKLLEGDWSIVEGAAFGEFNPKYHVSDPMDIPHTWRRFRSADYGYSSPACVLWFAIDPAYDTLYVYRELYGAGMTGIDLARKVLELEKNEQISYGILDSSVWHQRGHFGPSVAEEMIAAGCRWRPSDRGAGSRVAGKNRLHELLKLEEDPFGNIRPGIVFLRNCRQIINDLPSIPTDPDGGEDIDDRYPSDHSYDALRYGIMSRPRSTSPLDWGSTPVKYRPADSTFGY